LLNISDAAAVSSYDMFRIKNSKFSLLFVYTEQLSDELNTKEQFHDSINRQLRIVKGFAFVMLCYC